MTLNDIRGLIEQKSEQRGELWHRLSESYDPALAAELKRLDEDLARLWDAHRTARAQLRWGDRDSIVARARVEERLERAA